MRVPYQQLKEIFEKILVKHGVNAQTAAIAAVNFAQSSADGIYSHGVNRFPRLIQYLDQGLLDANAEPECIAKIGSIERWDGHMGLGNVNAFLAMEHACETAKTSGIGVVAIGNTNHWMRGGAYGWQAANQGCIGICWTNTWPNMPAWGGKNAKIGNNPFIISLPRSNGAHVVLDCAMSQFAYGKIEMARMKGEALPVPGGWDRQGRITTDPAEIEATQRVLPVGYWKGSGLSIVLDLVAAVLSGANSVTDIGRKYKEEIGLSQVLIAIDPTKFQSVICTDSMIDAVLNDIKSSEPVTPGTKLRYPGEHEWKTRADNLKDGIPVLDEVWQQILALQ